MPDSMEPGARVSERWSSGGAARVDLRRATRDTEDPMPEDRMALVELLQKSGEADFLRAVADSVLQILMEADVEGLIGAGRHERTGDRLNCRNGSQPENGHSHSGHRIKGKSQATDCAMDTMGSQDRCLAVAVAWAALVVVGIIVVGRFVLRRILAIKV